MAGGAAKSPPRSAYWNGTDFVFDADHGEPLVVRVDEHAVGAGEPPFRAHRDVLHRHRILDIAADHVERAGAQRDDNVAMRREPAGRQIVVADLPAAAP